MCIPSPMFCLQPSHFIFLVPPASSPSLHTGGMKMNLLAFSFSLALEQGYSSCNKVLQTKEIQRSFITRSKTGGITQISVFCWHSSAGKLCHNSIIQIQSIIVLHISLGALDTLTLSLLCNSNSSNCCNSISEFWNLSSEIN